MQIQTPEAIIFYQHEPRYKHMPTQEGLKQEKINTKSNKATKRHNLLKQESLKQLCSKNWTALLKHQSPAKSLFLCILRLQLLCIKGITFIPFFCYYVTDTSILLRRTTAALLLHPQQCLVFIFQGYKLCCVCLFSSVCLSHYRNPNSSRKC